MNWETKVLLYLYVFAAFTIYEGNTAYIQTIHDNYDQAKEAVDSMLWAWIGQVDTASTRIILYNGTPDNLTLAGSDHYSGRWQVPPPNTVFSRF